MAFSPAVLERLEFRKAIVSFMCLAGRLLLGLLMFIPLISSSTNGRLLLLITSYLAAYILLSFTMPAALHWIQTLTPIRLRGRYFGIRESYILAFVTVITLFTGRVLDLYKRSGKDFEGFMVLFIIVLLLDFLTL